MRSLRAWSRGGRAVLLALMVCVAFVGAVVAPLWTYGLSFVLFGPTHILSELRYVDRRFGATLHGSFGLGIAIGLAFVALARFTRVADLVPGAEARTAELLGVAALVLLAALRGPTAVAVLAGAAVVAGVAWDPGATLLILAILHNWTPVGFLLEVSEGPDRRLATWGAVLAFGLLPLLIASGLPALALAGIGLDAPEATAFAPGPLTAQLGVYLPEALRGGTHARALFSAVVFAQGLHYISVIALLPTLGAPGGGRWLARLPTAVFALGTLAAAGVFVVVSAGDFTVARSWYGIPGALHAWIELPLLIAALTSSRPG